MLYATIEALGSFPSVAPSASLRAGSILPDSGDIRLIPLQAVSVDNKLEGFKQILPLMQRNEEKKLLLGALAGINSPAAVEMILPHLDNAATAILAIAENILKGGKTN